MLEQEQLYRYARHILLPGVGAKGQEKLLASSVLVIGAGGLGSPAALYLAAAGVGRLGIVDFDVVDISNLQRQILHGTADIGQKKVVSAQQSLAEINPDVVIETYEQRLTADNILDIISDYDFIIDGTDNFASKFLINDACVAAGKAFSHAGILRFVGQTLTWVPDGKTPCYRCVFVEPPPEGAAASCQQAGILGSVAGVLGTLQATECLKYLLGVGELLTGRLFYLDLATMETRQVTLRTRADCPACSKMAAGK